MNCFTLILAVAACIAPTYAKPSGLLPAPLVAAPVAAPLAYPGPIVASRTAQVVQTNFNTLAAPYYAAPVVAAGYAYATPSLAAPVAARYAAAAPAVAAPIAPAPAALAAPPAAPVLPAPFPYYI